jgi:hypothetical protein
VLIVQPEGSTTVRARKRGKVVATSRLRDTEGRPHLLQYIVVEIVEPTAKGVAHLPHSAH